MKPNRLFVSCLILALAAALPVTAQQKDNRVSQPVNPLPPLPSGESSSRQEATASPEPNAAPQPDNNPLTGMQAFSLGGSGGRSYFVPTFRVTQIADSNGRSASGQHVWRGVTAVNANLNLQRMWNRRQLGINYTIGGIVANTQSGRRSHYHNFGFNYQAQWRRWQTLIADSFSFLPESNFGGGGLPGVAGGIGGIGGGGSGGGIGGIGGGLGSGIGGGIGGIGGGFVPGVIPNQSILTGNTKRFLNTVVGQVNYTINARTSWTMAGNFSTLQFTDPAFFDSNRYSFQTGINRQFTPADSVGFFYNMGMVRFPNDDRKFDTHSIQLAYGRKITGRLGLQIAGGPQFNRFWNGLLGQMFSRTNVTYRTNLAYSFPQTTLDLHYGYSTSTGSGVLAGAQTHRLELGAARPLGRVWRGSARIGYAHNERIRELAATTNQNSFHTLVFGLNLSRPLRRTGNMSFTYSLQRQVGDVSPCPAGTPACGRNILRHHLGLSFSWGFGPYEIE
jgi:hypothetical protein